MDIVKLKIITLNKVFYKLVNKIELFLCSIDDGDIRGYDDPQNREFLMSVMAGRIPKELVS